jgi:ADP-heptose:LPS heptosyltransferase
LLTTAGLMKLSTVIVGGDTGLLHLAVAMGKRVVMLIGSVTPGSPFPFNHSDWTITPPASRPVAGINAVDVIQACEPTNVESSLPFSAHTT